MDWLSPELLDVPVRGGNLRVARWPGDGPTVVAAHGITANWVSWARVAAALDGRATLLAPDLRGRGDSGTLPGPYGMVAHADDLVAVIDHVGADRAVVAGHSMGGFVTAVTATRHADRVERVVLVDGGAALAVPEGTDIDAVLQAVIGPAMQRLSMTFTSPQAYRDFWRDHPALRDDWDETVEAYIDHDLRGNPPEVRSKCALDAIRADGADTLVNAAARDAVHALRCPGVLLWAPRGLMDETPGLYTEERLSALSLPLPHRLVPDVNHYTILLTDAGARAVADALLDG